MIATRHDTRGVARVAAVANERGIRVVLDSSGSGLAEGLAGCGVFLVKPSIGELRGPTGEDLVGDDAIAEVASAIVRRGEAEPVAVTMGRGDIRRPGAGQS